MTTDIVKTETLPLLYLAAPLFSSAERRFNVDLAVRLSARFEVFLPQRDGRLFTEIVREGLTPRDAARQVFAADTTAIHQCHVLVAVLDGRSIDEGVAFEIGFAFSLGKTCVGLQTDVRRLLPMGNNPMIECAGQAVVDSAEGLVAWLDTAVAPKAHQRGRHRHLDDPY